jgi:asparagine synthase (glutamine-hydrolysing)
MSGIIGLVANDGASVSRHLFDRMTAFLSFRGPEGQEIWTDGRVGLGHALLRTTAQPPFERQPLSLGGHAWITADARVDARAELVQKLCAKGRNAALSASDAGLILHAYAVWGEACAEHLLGDFSFAIWDGAGRRLFCARDHFGVKPFYYAETREGFVFSNTLDCIRLHPAVSDQLDEQAIADFLLFDSNQDLAATAFANIRRLPPGHALSRVGGEVRIRRYWTLPVEGPTEFHRASDYVERFLELLNAAVEDRLRTDRVGVLMSGGLDSSTVAATAERTLCRAGGDFELRAYTHVYDQLIPHEERRYAGLVAKALRMPIHYLVGDDYRLYERWGQEGFGHPEPVHDPFAAMEADHLRTASEHSRVALTGYGGDPALASLLSSHFAKRIREWQLGRVARDLVSYLGAEGRLSRLYLRTRLRRWLSRNDWRGLFPPWLAETLVERLGLRERWEEKNCPVALEHPVRPEAHEAITAPLWPSLFEGYDPGVTGLPLEVRHPFFDVRLVRYLLTLPALPWCSDKELLRVALRGRLPDEARLRRKSPLAADPLLTLVHRPESRCVDSFEPVPELGQFVMRNRIPPVAGERDSWKVWIHLRPLSLNYWLQSLTAFKYKFHAEGEIVNSTQPKPPKKPYELPHLHVYGDIREITKTSAHRGAIFDAARAANKTH